MTNPTFADQIVRMNEMYELPQVGTEVHLQFARLDNFKKILNEECGEIEAIFDGPDDEAPSSLWVRTELADLLGDIIVYCTSEALRWNIPLPEVLEIIMQSNFSKLDEDGKPIKDERGKFLKGPRYWKPDGKIRELLDSQGDTK